MMIKAAPNQGINAEDFRDELDIEKIGKPVILEIHVSSTDNNSGVVSFQRIGHIELNESVISKTCDKRLHFSHPKWRDDLKHSNF